MSRLLRVYPRWWRERYGDEVADLVWALGAERGRCGRLLLAVNVARGALDARLQRPPRLLPSDPALRRGVCAGLVAAAVLAVDIVLTVVVFPPGPDESDSDPEYVAQLLATYVLLALLFTAVGWYARRGARVVRGQALPLAPVSGRTENSLGDRMAAAKGAGAAGLVVALSAELTYLVVDNVFFDIVSRQHDKRIAFAASGWTSMRAYVDVQLITGATELIPMMMLIAAGLGALGGLAVRRRTR